MGFAYCAGICGLLRGIYGFFAASAGSKAYLNCQNNVGAAGKHLRTSHLRCSSSWGSVAYNNLSCLSAATYGSTYCLALLLVLRPTFLNASFMSSHEKYRLLCGRLRTFTADCGSKFKKFKNSMTLGYLSWILHNSSKMFSSRPFLHVLYVLHVYGHLHPFTGQNPKNSRNI